MTQAIEKILEKECGLTKDKPIIVGVSGGPDSLCLMETIRQAGYSIVVAYFDHQLRSDSVVDARMVEKTATRLMLQCEIDGADVQKYSEEKKLSIEEAARILRYQFMFRLARQYQAQAVAVGHTADDQVETVLMHFLRGSGINGLKGMSYRSIIKTFDEDIPIIRPLLDMWREETVVYCAVHGLRPHYDSTNDSMSFQRNRIRHLLLPTLETYNPKFREAVLRMSYSLKGDHHLLTEILDKTWHEVVLETHTDFITLDALRLTNASLSLQANLLKQAIHTLRPSIEVTFSVIERALEGLRRKESISYVDLKGGLRLVQEGDLIYVCTNYAELPFAVAPQLSSAEPLQVLVAEQQTLLGGWKLNSEYWRLPALALEQAQYNKDPFQVWLDAEGLPEQFELRVRRAGDVFAPLGLDGHTQKLSDFFVNEKVPQRARENWPLLCAGDEIVWVPGFRPAHAYRLTAETKRVIYFSLTRPLEKSE
jgi:tRNA(Ile)-lysidine synthase